MLAGRSAGDISQGSMFSSMWVATYDQVGFIIAITQHEFCHISLLKSNQRASSDLNEGECPLTLNEGMASLHYKTEFGVGDTIVAQRCCNWFIC